MQNRQNRQNKAYQLFASIGALFFAFFAMNLAGCSTISGIGTDNTPAPTPLKAYHAQIAPKAMWSASAGSGFGGVSRNSHMTLAYDSVNNVIYTADYKGRVYALNATQGKVLWQADVKEPIIAGPAAGDGLVIVAGSHADVFALSAATHRVVWHAVLSNAVIATPVINTTQHVVILKTLDGQLWALRTTDGSVLWRYNHGAPLMVLAGGSKPAMIGDRVVTGYADGKMAAYGLNNGQLLWQTQVATPMGASAVEQMIDIVADTACQNNIIYAVTYQGTLAAINLATGNILWQQPLSSYTGMALSSEAVYVTDAKGDVWAFNPANGQALWHQTALRYRGLTAPVLTAQGLLVIGDAEGYLHWLNPANGETVGRLSVGGDGVVKIMAVNHYLAVLTADGKVVLI